MKILITVPQDSRFARYFPEASLNRLSRSADVTLNPYKRQFTREELVRELHDTDIVITHWGSAQYTAELLDCAPKLKLLAHCAGTVANIASEEFYIRRIPVLSANPVMSRYVAEGVLGYILSAVRSIPQLNQSMHDGKWTHTPDRMTSLFDSTVGIIGLGAVGRCLMELLAPIGCRVCVYDPYIQADALAKWSFARRSSFAEAMSQQIVTIHASQTPETYHMINAEALRLIPDGGLFVNTARGSLVDTNALASELESGRISAVLDVYDKESCAQPERLRKLGSNLIMQPHTAALPAGCRMTNAIIDDIERFIKGEPLRLTVSREQYKHMTQE